MQVLEEVNELLEQDPAEGWELLKRFSLSIRQLVRSVKHCPEHSASVNNLQRHLMPCVTVCNVHLNCVSACCSLLWLGLHTSTTCTASTILIACTSPTEVLLRRSWALYRADVSQGN